MIHNKIKHSVQLSLTLAVGIFAVLSLLFTIGQWSLGVASAQEPDGNSEGVVVDPADLAALGFSTAEISAAQAAATDLDIVKTASVPSLTAGNSIDYTIRITNTHPTDAAVVFFYDNYPSQLQGVTYAFARPATETTIFNNPKKTWVLNDPLPANQSVQVTVSGILTSNIDVTTINIAQALDAFGGSKDDSVSVDVIGVGSPSAGKTIYLPFIAKPEPVVLAYSENFNSGTPWPEFDNDGCKTDHQSGQYWVDVDRTNRNCLPPAKDENKPESPYRTYGEWQVDAYVSGEDQDENFWYGLFINGAGGDDYYYFRIQPNENGCSSGGDWELIRRKDDNETTLRSGSCHASIKRGYGGGATNTLKIRHTTDRTLSVFVNGTLLGSITEPNSSSHLTTTGVGLYVRSADKDVLVKFDNYIVNKFN